MNGMHYGNLSIGIKLNVSLLNFCSCCCLFAVLQDLLFNSQCLSILQFKLISIHASKLVCLFHFYISRINSEIYRMICWKKEKPKYPDKIFAQRMKKLLEKNYLH